MKLPFRSSGQGGEAGEMTLLEHLVELRKRIIRSVLAVLVGAIVVIIFIDPIWDVLKQPYCDYHQATGNSTCDFLVRGPMEAFSFWLSLVGYGGMILALPVVLYQIARFVFPGLYAHEKKALVPFIAGSVILLAAGMVSAYLVMPRALEVLLNQFGFEEFEAFFSPYDYVGFFVRMLFAFGVAAELPIVLIFLQLVGVVRPETLSGNRRIAVVAIVLLGAIITPTGDPFNLALVSVPMYLFYEISILVGKRLVKRRSKPARAGVAG